MSSMERKKLGGRGYTVGLWESHLSSYTVRGMRLPVSPGWPVAS
jgi:hypothetical protein